MGSVTKGTAGLIRTRDLADNAWQHFESDLSAMTGDKYSHAVFHELKVACENFTSFGVLLKNIHAFLFLKGCAPDNVLPC